MLAGAFRMRWSAGSKNTGSRSAACMQARLPRALSAHTRLARHPEDPQEHVQGRNIAWWSRGSDHVELCDGFFSARESAHWRTDEGTRVGALVHEAFHFVTGIDDNVPYIQEACGSDGCGAEEAMGLAKNASY